LGGRVRWHGKPHPSVYEHCFSLLGIDDRRRILAVGDSLGTDIAGANAAGIDSLLVADGIHAADFGLGTAGAVDLARLTAAVEAAGHRPTAVLTQFRW
jgi:ribonucleotide monophosphatase NagD (HAD superfamily)